MISNLHLVPEFQTNEFILFNNNTMSCVRQKNVKNLIDTSKMYIFFNNSQET